MNTSLSKIVGMSILGLVFSGVLSLQAADYTIDPAHSSVGFSVRHIVSQTHGQFGQFEGTFSYDPAHPEKSRANAVISWFRLDAKGFVAQLVLAMTSPEGATTPNLMFVPPTSTPTTNRFIHILD